MESNTSRRHQARDSFRQYYFQASNEQLIQAIQQNRKLQKIDYCLYLIQILQERGFRPDPTLQQEFYEIEEIYIKTERCLKYLDESTEGWRIDRFGGDKHELCTKVFNRSEVMMRYQGTIEINMYNLCSMVYQVGLFKQWVPFCKESKDIKTVGTASKIAWLKFDLPFISSRQGYFYGQGIDRTDTDGTVVIYCEGITGRKPLDKKLGVNLQRSEKSVDLDLKFMVAEFQIVDFGVVTVRAYGHIDIKMTFIPEFVLGFFSKKIGSFLMEKMINTANNIKGTEWEKRILANSDGFYSWLKDRIDNFHKGLEEKNKKKSSGMTMGISGSKYVPFFKMNGTL